MNVERLRKLADVIEALPSYYEVPRAHDSERPEEECFRMRRYKHPCGAPACIAGWAEQLWGQELRKDIESAAEREGYYHDYTYDTSYIARKVLGLFPGQSALLFAPENNDASYKAVFGRLNISPKRAAAQLRHVADTGIVDWSATPSEEVPA